MYIEPFKRFEIHLSTFLTDHAEPETSKPVAAHSKPAAGRSMRSGGGGEDVGSLPSEESDAEVTSGEEESSDSDDESD